MSKKAEYIALLAASGMLGQRSLPSMDKLTEEETELAIEAQIKRIKGKRRVINLNKGLTPFVHGDVTVWAINNKNAIRKAKKLGLI